MPSTPPHRIEDPRILVTGWAGAGNVGDELLTRAMVAELRRLGATPVIASRDPAATEALHGVESVPWGPAGLRAVASVHGVCLGPGGVVQDSSSLWSLPLHLVAPGTARRRGVPVAAIGVGAESLRRRSSAWLLRRVLGDRPVVTRDPESTAALGEAGVAARTGIDVVFGLELPEVTRTNEIVVSVGGHVRPGTLAPAGRRVEAPPVAAIAAALDRLAAGLDAPVVLTRFRGDRDASVAVDVARRLAAPAEVLGPDVDEHIRRVLGAACVVTSRYHPVVLAARGGVPAIAVSAQAKVQSLVAQVSPLAVAVPDWAAVSPAARPVVADPLVPEGLAPAREALGRLVDEARALRDQGQGG